LCYFFETQRDLLETSLPFFQAGMENREFCLWIACAPLTEAEAVRALRESIPGMDRYLAEGGLEIHIHADPIKPGDFEEARRRVAYLHTRLRQALERGYTGMRVAGSPSGIQKTDPKLYLAFERELAGSVVDQRMIALCQFPLTESSAAEILDAARTHELVVATRHGNCEVIETPDIKFSKAEIARLNEQLERRVEERSQALQAANEELREEIARREAVEEDLRRQKEILQTIFDHIPIMISFMENGQFLLVNREWERTLGRTLEEIKSQDIDIVAENYPEPAHRQEVEDFYRGSHGEWKDFKTRLGDGRIIDVSWAVLRLSGGRVICFGQDITGRKRTEEALHETEERFRQLAENIQDLFWIKTPDLKQVIYYSPRYESVSGRSREDAYRDYGNQHLLSRIIPEDRERMAEFLERGGDEEFQIEFRFVLPDGSVAWVCDRGFPIRDASGQIYGVAGLSQDITERKLAEQALRESEERFRQLAENINEVFWITTADFSRQVYVSPGFQNLTGQPPETLYPGDGHRPFLSFVHPDDRPLLSGITKKPDQEFDVQYRVLRADGSVRWVRDRGFPIRNQAGQIYRVGGVMEDITDRKEADDRLKATTEQLRALSARLQSAREKEATRIARQIHDDMGGILTGLRWELEALEKSILEPADPEQLRVTLREKLATMIGLTDTTINVVRRIASELRPSILDDLGLVEAIEWQTQQFQARTGIECGCHCSLQSIPLGNQQSTAVFRIVQEALTNILRHAQATRVGVAMREEDGVLILTVTDNGRGITEAEKTGTNSLGLLGMQERAHLIGGRVDIVGRKGTGTKLHVRVPLRRAKQAGAV
jgi:PAS domain S-box-containing protein